MDYNDFSTNGSNTVCAESYYLNNNGNCLPLCTLWVDPPDVGLDADNIAVLISVITAVLFSDCFIDHFSQCSEEIHVIKLIIVA